MAQTDSYGILAARLKYPESKRLKRVLEVLMTPQEAAVAVELPAPAADIARKAGLTEEQVKQKAESLYQRGVVFPTSKGYFFARSLVQLHDATQSDARQDAVYGQKLFDAWEDFCDNEWFADLGREKTTVGRESMNMRIVPMYRAIKNIKGVMPCEDMREIMREAGTLSIVPCPCRRQSKRCSLPADNCIQTGRGAEYAISRGTGKRLSVDQVMAVVDETEEVGLVHRVPNKRSEYGVVCNCCLDDCMSLRAFKKIGKLNEGDFKSRFLAKVDQEACTGCQLCIDRCQFEAVELVKVPGSKRQKAYIDEAKCMGCGSCVIKCPEEAIAFSLVRPEEHIPVK